MSIYERRFLLPAVRSHLLQGAPKTSMLIVTSSGGFGEVQQHKACCPTKQTNIKLQQIEI